MKKLLGTRFDSTLSHIWLLLLRVFSAAFILTHGYPKLIKLFGDGEIQFGDPIGIGPAASLTLAVFAEFLCAILLALGVFTRLAAIPLIIIMSVAAFLVHAADSFGRKELALMYLLVWVTLVVFGGGKYSIDGLLFGKKADN